MCGFTGICSPEGRKDIRLPESIGDDLAHRGPDQSGEYKDDHCHMVHARLSILDPSEKGRQPMSDASGRYVLAYNGEIYNFKQLRQQLRGGGISFESDSDTEVLANLFAKKGADCINDLNGCFAAAVYDKEDRSVTLIRDRFGINPLHYTIQKGTLCFSSELSGLLSMDISKKIDYESLGLYLQLNYIPQPWTILEDVYKLKPGHYIKFDKDGIHEHRYYSIPDKETITSYDEALEKGRELMEESVKERLIADVPVGSFLSGGLDSSIVAMLANRHHDSLHTFSVGYKDDPIYDETEFAVEVADHIGAEHTVFELSDQEMLDNLDAFLDSIDEPFADSSALAVYLLSKKTREDVKVALSGDGADELFAGYLKHMAHHSVIAGGVKSRIARVGAPVWKAMPKSRSSKMGNVFRKLDRFSKGAKLDPGERYWRWASILGEKKALNLLKNSPATNRKEAYIHDVENNLDSVLRADVGLVLPGDMLHKVDRMSMANSLEVRVPFLNHNVVEFAFSLPDAFKIHGKKGKRILHDLFKDDLPPSIYRREKHGFEVPLNKWMNGELKDRIDNDWLDEDQISEGNIFSVDEVRKLKKRLWSKNPGDAAATVWALIIFEHWKSKYAIEA